MKIYLCYRPSDMSGQAPLFAAKIVQRLKAQYGPNAVIMDPGVVPPGADFKRFLRGFVGQADVFLALIGPQWADLMRRHAHEEQDFVRGQIEAALAIGLPVMPIVIDTTPMPGAEELPPSIASLADQSRFRLTSGSELGPQLGQLMQHIETAAPQATVAMASPAAAARKVREDHPVRRRKKTSRGIMATVAWMVAIPFAAFLAYTIFPNFKPTPAKAPTSDPSKDYLNSIGDRMVWCVPGTFKMGSPVSEPGRSENETQHDVTVTQGYWIGAHEITQAQWKLVMGAYHKSFRSQFGTACPVTHVTWPEAVQFCEKLSAREGRSYRLPTEAEWEYACRAGTTGPRNVEVRDLGAFAWHAGNSKGLPQLVGEKDRNNWGLQDMHGNVFEWCSDWYAPSPADPVTDPKGPETGELKVYRSSSFDMGEAYHRSAYRAGHKPDEPASNIGFRVVSFGAPPAAAAAPRRPSGPELSSSAPTASAASIREELIAPETKVRFIYCPPGKFIMGEGEKTREITITQGFWLGETEITRSQWIAVMGKRGTPSGPNRGNRVPIDQIGWDDIVGRGGFLEKIQDKAPAGFAFALPTEAQWEYACRAGTTTKYWWGDEFIPGGANVANAPNTPEGGQVSFFEAKALPTGATMTIKSLKANPWGFYDISGNVWEWCQDWYEETPSGSNTDPTGPASGDLKVLRGGAWNDVEQEARSASRLRYFPAFRGATFGFRLALIPKP